MLKFDVFVQGAVWPVGTLSQLHLVRLFGTSHLLILLHNTLLPRKFALWVHSRDHKFTLFGNLARLRQYVWVVEGRKLMRTVIILVWSTKKKGKNSKNRSCFFSWTENLNKSLQCYWHKTVQLFAVHGFCWI